MPDISSAIALLRKPIEAVAESAAGKAKEAFARIRATDALKGLYGKLNATQKVKTIWNIDRAISISSFYYPARVKSSEGWQQLMTLDELPNNHVILSGIVGQGKSILLRYLLGKEIRSGTRVPIFVELRRVPVNISLENHIRASFYDLLDVSEESQLFHFFAREGRLSILLDGFDEVDPSRVQAFAASIDALAQAFQSIRIVVTSRPNSGIENSPLFDVVQISQLQSADLPGFFQKILKKDRPLADRLSEALGSSASVAGLASTPLLATLLTIVYRAHQRIPTNFPEFYDELFQILLVRHDRSKGGYERKRKTKLGDRDIQLVFEAFCYKTRADGTSVLTRPRAIELAAVSAKAQQLECDPSDFLQDIIKVTCLLQEEGMQIEYLHQSVQEFFAARYIASRPEEVAKKFYTLALEPEKWQQWDQVIGFLNQIDKYRSSAYFFIPVLESTLKILGASGGTLSSAKLRQLLSERNGVRQVMSAGDNGQIPKYYIHQLEIGNIYRIEIFRSRLYSSIFRSAIINRPPWRECFDGKTDGQYVSYAAIAAHCSLANELDASLLSAVEEVREELNQHRERMRAQDESTGFMGL